MESSNHSLWPHSSDWFLGSFALTIYTDTRHLYQCKLSEYTTVFVAQYVRLFATPWTGAHQTPLSTEFSRQECWSELPFPPLEDLPNLGIELVSLASPSLAGRFFATEPPGNKSNYGHVEFECLWELQGEDGQQTVGRMVRCVVGLPSPPCMVL